MKQVRPPAWTQEAYRPPGEYSCTISVFLLRVKSPEAGGGGPRMSLFSEIKGVFLFLSHLGVPRFGYHPIKLFFKRVFDFFPGGGYLTRTPPSPPPRCGQTNKVKLLPSRRTTYAGGNKFLYVPVPESGEVNIVIYFCFLSIKIRSGKQPLYVSVFWNQYFSSCLICPRFFPQIKLFFKHTRLFQIRNVLSLSTHLRLK